MKWPRREFIRATLLGGFFFWLNLREMSDFPEIPFSHKGVNAKLPSEFEKKINGYYEKYKPEVDFWISGLCGGILATHRLEEPVK